MEKFGHSFIKPSCISDSAKIIRILLEIYEIMMIESNAWMQNHFESKYT
jgi:hypothetical protein